MDIENIKDLGKDLIELANHVESLEKQVKDYESKKYESNCLQSTDCYLNRTPLFVYRPVAQIKQKPKCNKCNEERLIQTDDSFSFSFVTCDCANPIVTYSPETLCFNYLYSDGNVHLYVSLEGDKEVKLNKTFILDRFEELHLTRDPECLFYDKIEECEEFCRRKNNES